MTALGLPARDRKLYRFLYKRLHLPRGMVHGMMSGLRGRRLGDELSRRQKLAAQLDPGALDLDPSSAWRMVAAGESEDLTRLAGLCQEHFDRMVASGKGEEVRARNPQKQFLLGVLHGNEFLDHPELVRLMVARPIVDAAARYLGAIPRLEGSVLWWTPPNDSRISSQQWHIDELAQRQVKILLNCSEVSADCGPLHFVAADRSDELREQMGHRRGRVDEQRLTRNLEDSEILQATGRPGSAVMLDSSRCLHFGSRGNRRDRLVLAFHFFAPPSPVDSRYHIELGTCGDGYQDLDPIQKLALGHGLD
jgi:hypothetical protein